MTNYSHTELLSCKLRLGYLSYLNSLGTVLYLHTKYHMLYYIIQHNLRGIMSTEHGWRGAYLAVHRYLVPTLVGLQGIGNWVARE